jgi:hypothetical protein
MTREEALAIANKYIDWYWSGVEGDESEDGVPELAEHFLTVKREGIAEGWRLACEECAKKCDGEAEKLWDIFKNATDGRRGDVYHEGASDEAETCATKCRKLANKPMLRSACCNAKVRVEPVGTTRPWATHWYVCTKCEKPCDVAERRV